ncbi:hypothetical protein HNR39_003681 [Glaciimonas immobilis]|uniref:Uncharacterized protein n=1 Tax=Glaciimonas immobilis TaxID=728004 RepID=A0A840RW51_9BURK|nr:hypothetical protein [Glaciimonas immobilis]
MTVIIFMAKCLWILAALFREGGGAAKPFTGRSAFVYAICYLESADRGGCG